MFILLQLRVCVCLSVCHEAFTKSVLFLSLYSTPDYPIKSLRHNGDLLARHLLGRTPPSSELLQRRKKKRQNRIAAVEKEEDWQEGVEVDGWDGGDRGDVEMTANRKKIQYSPIRLRPFMGEQ